VYILFRHYVLQIIATWNFPRSLQHVAKVAGVTFLDSDLFLFQNIWIVFRNIFNFEILTPVQTPATFAAIEIQQYLNLSNWQLYRGARSLKGASRNFEGGACSAMLYNMESFWTRMHLFKRYTKANFTLL